MGEDRRARKLGRLTRFPLSLPSIRSRSQTWFNVGCEFLLRFPSPRSRCRAFSSRYLLSRPRLICRAFLFQLSLSLSSASQPFPDCIFLVVRDLLLPFFRLLVSLWIEERLLIRRASFHPLAPSSLFPSFDLPFSPPKSSSPTFGLHFGFLDLNLDGVVS